MRLEADVVLPRGSTLLLYTGLVERRNEALDEGMARAAGVLTDGGGAPPPVELAELLTKRLLADAPDDDVALPALPPWRRHGRGLETFAVALVHGSRTARNATSSSSSLPIWVTRSSHSRSSGARPMPPSPDQPGRSLVERQVALLDQPVGVEEQRVAGAERDSVVRALGVGRTPSRRSGVRSSSLIVPSAQISTGGGWPALDQRRVRPSPVPPRAGDRPSRRRPSPGCACPGS